MVCYMNLPKCINPDIGRLHLMAGVWGHWQTARAGLLSNKPIVWLEHIIVIVFDDFNYIQY